MARGCPLDEDTKAIPRHRTRGPSGVEYDDCALAADLLKLAEQAESAIAAPQHQACLQRVRLAAQFLIQATASPMVPESLRPHHEALLLPLLKAAVADTTLFTSAFHPLSCLINEVALTAALSRIHGDGGMPLMRERMQDFLAQFDLSPDFVKAAMAQALPLTAAQVRWFLELQHQQAVERRDAVMAEARRRVMKALEKSSFGRDVPGTALHFLKTAWGSLLVRHLLEHGDGHFRWQTGLAMMDQLLDLLETRGMGTAPPPAWNNLISAIVADLAAAGFDASALAAAVTDLEMARRSGRSLAATRG